MKIHGFIELCTLLLLSIVILGSEALAEEKSAKFGKAVVLANEKSSGTTALAVGTLSGIIVDSVSKTTPVHPVFIDLMDPLTGDLVEGFETANLPDGSYQISDIPVGEYKVFFNADSGASGYADELYDGVFCDNGGCDRATLGTPFTVLEGSNLLDVGLELKSALFGTLTGVIVDSVSNSTPVHPVFIDLMDPLSGDLVEGFGTVNLPDGSYQISDIPFGEYKVFFNADSGASGYADELYDGVFCDNGGCDRATLGTQFTVSEGSNILDVDLELKSALSGRVTDTKGRPFQNIEVKVLSESGDPVGDPVSTNSNGEWIKSLPGPGSYFVRITGDQVSGYSPEVWNNIPCNECDIVANGTPIEVVDNHVSGIDFELNSYQTSGGSIFDSGFELAFASVSQLFEVDVPALTAQNGELISVTGAAKLTDVAALSDVATISDDATLLVMPEKMYSFVFLFDEQENILGIYYGLPSPEGSPLRIDATSTAISLVISLPANWQAASDSMDQYIALIQSQNSFETLRVAVQSVMSSDAPENLLSDPNGDIYPAVAAVFSEIYEPLTVNAQAASGLQSSDAMKPLVAEYPVPNMRPDPATVFGVELSNPRMNPFGLAIIDTNTMACPRLNQMNGKPKFVPGRDIIDLFFRDDFTVSLPLDPGDYVVCQFKREPSAYDPLLQITRVNALEPFDLVRPIDLEPDFPEFSQTAEDYMELFGRARAEFAWQAHLFLNLVSFVPVSGDILAIGRDPFLRSIAFASDTFDRTEFPLTAFLPLTFKGIEEFLEAAVANREAEGSFVRFLSKVFLKDGRKISAKTTYITSILKMGARGIGTVLTATDYVNVILLKIDTDDGKHQSCQQVKISRDAPALISDYNGALSQRACDPVLLQVEKLDLSSGELINGGMVRSAVEGVLSIDCGVKCQSEFITGSVVELTASAMDGFEFVKWSEDGECPGSIEPVCEVTLDGDKLAQPLFVEDVGHVETKIWGVASAYPDEPVNELVTWIEFRFFDSAGIQLDIPLSRVKQVELRVFPHEFWRNTSADGNPMNGHVRYIETARYLIDVPTGEVEAVPLQPIQPEDIFVIDRYPFRDQVPVAYPELGFNPGTSPLQEFVLEQAPNRSEPWFKLRYRLDIDHIPQNRICLSAAVELDSGTIVFPKSDKFDDCTLPPAGSGGVRITIDPAYESSNWGCASPRTRNWVKPYGYFYLNDPFGCVFGGYSPTSSTFKPNAGNYLVCMNPDRGLEGEQGLKLFPDAEVCPEPWGTVPF